MEKEKNRDIFIAIEGGEGTGKSTLTTALQQAFRDVDFFVGTYGSPGSTKVGKILREQVTFNKQKGFYTRRLAFLLDYSEMLDDILLLKEKARKLGIERNVVIADRFTPISGIVYQEWGEEKSALWSFPIVEALNTEVLKPDLVLYMRPDDPSVAVERSFLEKPADIHNSNDLEGYGWKFKIMCGYERVMNASAVKERYNIKTLSYTEDDDVNAILEKAKMIIATEFGIKEWLNEDSFF